MAVVSLALVAHVHLFRNRVARSYRDQLAGAADFHGDLRLAVFDRHAVFVLHFDVDIGDASGVRRDHVPVWGEAQRGWVGSRHQLEPPGLVATLVPYHLNCPRLVGDFKPRLVFDRRSGGLASHRLAVDEQLHLVVDGIDVHLGGLALLSREGPAIDHGLPTPRVEPKGLAEVPRSEHADEWFCSHSPEQVAVIGLGAFEAADIEIPAVC